MDITRKDINTITFEEVVEFCQQKVIENLFLDYKKNKPADLSRHIAGFSNAAGGLIIIGVEEDANGYPSAWEGINNTNKPTDWAHQMANNVVPLPSYEAAVTNEVGGKVFLLVRILEGDSTPYVTKNDPTIWVRTGNVRTPLGQANREDLIQLVAKSSNAVSARQSTTQHLEFEFKQLETHQNEYERRNATRLGNLPTRSDEQRSLLKITIMPFNPSRKIIDLKELSNLNVLMAKFVPNGSNLASFVSGVQPVANGLARLRHLREGAVESIQIKDTGVLNYVADIAEFNGGNNKSIWVYHILKHIMDIMLPASLLYRSYGYSGLVSVQIQLNNIQGSNVYRVTIGSRDMADDDLYAVSHTYNWDYQFTTAEINDKEAFVNGVAELLENIHWDLGDQGIGLDNAKAKINSDFNFGVFGLNAPEFES